MFSCNRRDLAHLHKIFLVNDRHHAGIILSDQPETGVMVKRLFNLLAELSAADMRDRLEYLGNWR